MTKKLAKILIIGVLIIMSVGLLVGCGNKDGKIDIGVTTAAGKPPAFCQVRVVLENDVFSRNSEIKIEIGLGFIGSDIRWVPEGVILKLTIDAANFAINGGENAKVENRYEKEFDEYSDSKFVCIIKNERYIPSYSETFELQLSSNDEIVLGIILASATLVMEDNGGGKTERIYYATNSESIAFSANSIEDAQKKLK